MLLTLVKKKEIASALFDLCFKSTYIVVVNYMNLTVAKLDRLRVECRALGVKVSVCKNSIIYKALKDTMFDGICEHLNRPTIFFFMSGDIAIFTRKINDMYVKDGFLEFKCFFFDGQIYNVSFLDRIVHLPNIDVVLARLLCTLKNIVVNLLCVIREIYVKFIKLLINLEIERRSKSLN